MTSVPTTIESPRRLRVGAGPDRVGLTMLTMLSVGNVVLALFMALGVFARFHDGPPKGKTVIDFATYYTGGRMAGVDRGARMYDLVAQAKDQTALAGVSFDPQAKKLQVVGFVNPPTTALFLRPLSLLPLTSAYRLWMILEAALLVAAGWVALGIRRQFPKRAFDCFIDESKPMHKNRRDTGFAVLAMVAAFPVGAALLQGSLAPMVALGFAMFAKGVIEKSSQISHRFSDVLVAGGLLLVGMKPQYVILPLVVLLGLRRWKAIGFTAIAQAILMALSALIVRPSAWIDYLKLLGIYNREIDTYGSGTSSMINIRGILAYTLGAGRASTINVVSTAALLAAAIGIGFLAHRARNAASKTALVIAMLLAGMIASPHAHSHDWTVALVALALAWFLPGMTSGKRLVLALVPLVSYLSLGGFDSLIGKLPVALAFGGLIVAIRFMRADETYLS